ncbi:hypothetical protein CsSME_00048571 [Camellia sinensis var. sinensis]
MSLVANEEFQHILRVQNTNVDGKQKIMFAMTSIKGIGRRFTNIVCKKADVDMNKRAGELSNQEIGRVDHMGFASLLVFFFFLCFKLHYSLQVKMATVEVVLAASALSEEITKDEPTKAEETTTTEEAMAPPPPTAAEPPAEEEKVTETAAAPEEPAAPEPEALVAEVEAKEEKVVEEVAEVVAELKKLQSLSRHPSR